MIKTIHKLLLIAVMFATASCVTDEIDTGGSIPTQGANEVILRLKAPGNFAVPKTRALNYAQENTIGNIYVLVFDTDNELVDIQKGEDVNDNTSGPGAITSPYDGDDGHSYSGEGTFSVTLSQMGNGNKYKLLVLANAEAMLESCGFIAPGNDEFESEFIGDTYAEVSTSLYGGFTAPLYGTGGTIPMWGETALTVVSSAVALPAIKMKRALARIDVGVGEYNETDNTWNGKKGGSDIPFALKSVYVMMPQNCYAIVPDPAKASTVPTPAGSKYTVITESSVFNYSVANDRSITYGIYVPESDVKGAAAHAERMAIVVEGRYGGSTSYYRLDFADAGENLLDVLRNHLYRFTITGVDGAGYSSVKEAYEALPMNITSETKVIDEDFSGKTAFDNQYYLTADPGEFTFEGTAGSQTLNVDTDYPTWTAKVCNGYGTELTDTWLTATPSSGANGETPVTLTVGVNPSVYNSRNVYVHITAGRMTLIVPVTQNPAPYYVFAAPGQVGIKKSDYDKLKSGALKIKEDNDKYSLTLKGSSTYAASNQNGNTLVENIAVEFGGLEDEPVYAVYFKWGSMVAMIGGATDYWSQDDVVWVNNEYDLVTNPITANTNDGSGTASSYPYSGYGGFSAANHTTTGGDNDIIDNKPKGEGDICNELTGGTYRTPRGNPWFGIAATGWRHETTINIGTGTESLVNSDNTIFLPMAGYRYSYSPAGTMYGENIHGYYWSSTAGGTTSGFSIWFRKNIETGAYGLSVGYQSPNYAYGLSVRCVPAY